MTDIIERPMTPEEEEEQNVLAEQQSIILVERATVARRLAYQEISDPVFFKWQRGEATEQEYLDAVEQVKADYPIPGE